MILGALTLLGVLLAWLLGADPRRLALVRLRASWVVFVALAVQLLLFTPASGAVHLPLSESSAHVLTYAALLGDVPVPHGAPPITPHIVGAFGKEIETMPELVTLDEMLSPHARAWVAAT